MDKNATNNQSQVSIETKTDYNIFPYSGSIGRMNYYDYYERLFIGDHFSAFGIKIDNEQYNREYAKLRYVKANFAGLLSKIMADMLFSEPVIVKDEDNQDFIDTLWHENKMDVQCYESALSNSALGDALFKIRVGKRRPNDTSSSIIIEDITPKIYFPHIDGFNVRAEPDYQELAWTFKFGGKEYLRKEIHKIGTIENELYEMQGNKIMAKVPLNTVSTLAGIKDIEQTGIEEYMLVHIPNWKTGNRFFGISDYYDMDNIFYAINNRITMIDNILDKHGDPILMMPKGILNEKGQVNRKALGVIEVQDGENNKPEYIVWDASLENAFKEIEKLVEFMYLTGEISPDILGVGQGVSDSGRALKFKLMRTIAKAQRKKLYYDYGIKQIIYVAELLAKKHNLKAKDVAFKGEPKAPEIDWADGLPIDSSEAIDTETKAIDAGLTSKKDAIMRIYGVNEETAEKMIEDMKEEDAIKMPTVNTAGMNFGNNTEDNANGENGDDLENNGENGTNGTKKKTI